MEIIVIIILLEEGNMNETLWIYCQWLNRVGLIYDQKSHKVRARRIFKLKRKTERLVKMACLYDYEIEKDMDKLLVVRQSCAIYDQEGP